MDVELMDTKDPLYFTRLIMLEKGNKLKQALYFRQIISVYAFVN